jgi:hypothetical protein
VTRCGDAILPIESGVAEEVSEPEIRAEYESRVATWREWQPVAAGAQGDGAWMRAMQCGAPRYRALRSGRRGL